MKVNRKSKRSRFEGYKDILEFCRNVPQNRNQVCLHTDLTSERFNSWIQVLVRGELLEVVLVRRHLCYLTTQRGKEYIDRYYALVGILNCVEAKVK